MKHKLLLLTIIAVLWPVAAYGQRIDPEKIAIDRPNIVVLLADDLGYGELGCQGNPQIPTPHIDSIATAGVRMTSGYVAASYCSPSRAGLITGRYPTRFGYEFNPIGAVNEDPRVGLPRDEVTLAEHLHAAGYATGLIGKWHLGGTAAYHPLRHGFDEFFGFLHEGHFYVPPPYEGVTTMLRRRRLPDGKLGRWTSRDGRLVLSTHMGHDEPPYDADNPILRQSQPVQVGQYLTDAWTQEGARFIQRHRGRPFLLVMAYNAVHSPLQAPQHLMEELNQIEDIHRRIFAGMLTSLDHSVGKILQTLRDEGLERKTLVFFLSDNGGPTRELTSSNLPLRGGKGDVYEGGIRVPFLIQWKGTLPAGAVYDPPTSSLDIFPTAAAAAGVPVPQDLELDGVNLLPFLAKGSERAPHQMLFWRQGRRTAIRLGQWKLLRNPGRRAAPGDWQLYNLEKDPGESTDLATRYPERLEALKTRWQQLDSQMAPPLWGPRR